MIEGYGVPPAQGTVRVATRGDAPVVAALHSSAISEGFLSTLGDRFLSRLYTRIVSSSHGFLLVADRPQPVKGLQPRLAGFVAGSAGVGGLYREFVVRDGVSVAVSSGARLVRSLPRVVETLRYGARDEPAPRNAVAPRGAVSSAGARGTETELLALAVDPSERRRGVGAVLVEAFLTTAREAGSTSARVVVGSDNSGAIALYSRAGFRESSRLELHSGAESLLMRVDLRTPQP
jgi:ribosomal protein S18 acetylase RimI-like enzyme